MGIIRAVAMLSYGYVMYRYGQGNLGQVFVTIVGMISGYVVVLRDD